MFDLGGIYDRAKPRFIAPSFLRTIALNSVSIFDGGLRAQTFTVSSVTPRCVVRVSLIAT